MKEEMMALTAGEMHTKGEIDETQREGDKSNAHF